MNSRSSFNEGALRQRQANGALGRLFCFVALAAVLAGSWHRVSKVHRQRLLDKAQGLAPRVQTWEGEGGRIDDEHGPG